MHFFLDTTVFHEDAFLKKLYNQLLLKITEKNGFTIYISEVVLQEVRNHYEKSVLEQIKKLKESTQSLNSSPLVQINVPIPTKEEYLNTFDDYYRALEGECIVEIVGYDNDMLPELIRRSIGRIKPFTEAKQEFRDAVIWLSYAKNAEEHDLKDCFLITNNSSDYLKGNDLHPDLKKDSRRFKVYKNTYGLMHQEEKLQPYKTNVELEEWVEDNPFTEDYVLKLLYGRAEFETFREEVAYYIRDITPDRFDDDIITESGYCEIDGMDITDVDDLEVEVILEDILIRGIATVVSDVELYVWNPFRERGDEDFLHVGSKGVKFAVPFTITYDKDVDEPVQLLEIEDIYIKRKY